MDLPKQKFHLESGLNQRDRAKSAASYIKSFVETAKFFHVAPGLCTNPYLQSIACAMHKFDCLILLYGFLLRRARETWPGDGRCASTMVRSLGHIGPMGTQVVCTLLRR